MIKIEKIEKKLKRTNSEMNSGISVFDAGN